MKNMRAQGTIEYLVIIAIVVIIALVVVGILTGFLENGSTISSTSQNITQKTQTLALNDIITNPDGNYLLEIQSNQTGTITINQITTDTNQQIYYANNTQTLGSKKYYTLYTNDICQDGTNTTQTIIINYTTEYGLEKKVTYENVIIPCQTYDVNPQTNLAQTTPTIPEIEEVEEPLTLSLTQENIDGTSDQQIINIEFEINKESTCSLQIENQDNNTNIIFPIGTNIIDANLAHENIRALAFESEYTLDYNITCVYADDINTQTGTITTQYPTLLKLRENLEGYWAMDEASGSTIYNLANNSNPDATIIGGTRTTGKVNGGVNISSTSGQRIEIPAGTWLVDTFSNDFTIGGWFKGPSVWESTRMCFNFFEGGGSETFGLYLVSSNGSGFVRENKTSAQISYNGYPSQGVNALWGPTITLDNQWHHEVVIVRDNNLELYIDGVMQDIGPLALTNVPSERIISTTSKIIIGADSAGTRRLQGYTDEIALWSRALTYDELLWWKNGVTGQSLPT